MTVVLTQARPKTKTNAGVEDSTPAVPESLRRRARQLLGTEVAPVVRREIAARDSALSP